ncbi:MAG: T9SS type A sorting domain-containing protein [Bacteroidales bacterium]|nr:T9SS type A sorting domain-containing protein [Bacteroidales bacterium]
MDTNKIWQSLEYCQWGVDPYINSYFIKIGVDTVLNSHVYKKIYYSKSENFDTVNTVGFIREDNRKVYFLANSSLEEGLLYDFGISVGEQVAIQNYYLNNSTKNLLLKEIVNIDIAGKQVSKYIFQGTEEYWLEGIGSIFGILNSGFGDTTDCYYDLICFKENLLTYINPKYSNCDLTTSHVRRLDNEKYNICLKIVHNRVIILSSAQTISKVKIFDISGKMIYNQLHGDTIDISPFSKGLYLIRVYDINNHVSVFKIVKK